MSRAAGALKSSADLGRNTLRIGPRDFALIPWRGSADMNCCGMSFGFWRADAAREASAAQSGASTRNGSSAGPPIAAVWPEQGQRAAGAFLSRLGGGKDIAEFDRFMADRAGRSRASA
jgi:hypothetical protein